MVVVLGHEYCGAIKSAIDDVVLGNVTTLLSKIKPAVVKASQHFNGPFTSANPEFVKKVCHDNVEVSIDEIRTKSQILKEMEDDGEIKIIGAVYDMETGKATFLD